MNYFLTPYYCAEFQISLEKALISHLSFPFLNLAELLSIEKEMEDWISFWAMFLNLCEAVILFDKPKNLTTTPKILTHLFSRAPLPNSPRETFWSICQRRFSLEDFERFAFCGWCYKNYRHLYFPDIKSHYNIKYVYFKSMPSPIPSPTPWRLSYIPLFYLRITDEASPQVTHLSEFLPSP